MSMNKNCNNDMKESFINYVSSIGTESRKCENSYELNLILALLSLAEEDGKMTYNTVCSRIIALYSSRRVLGLALEKSDSKIEINKECLTTEVVKLVMDENAFNGITEQGYVFKQELNAVEYVCFNKELWQGFSYDEKNELKELLLNKLNSYYEKI